MNPLPGLFHALCYIKARLGEGTTWAAISAGAAAVAALPAPWSYIGFGGAIMAAMLPNRGKGDECQ
jgi:hypothetical protein